MDQITGRNGQDVAKEIGWQIGSITGRQEDEDYPQGHAQRPDTGNGRIFPQVLAWTGPLHTQGSQYRKEECHPYRIQPQIEAQSQPAKRGMSNASADEDQPTRHNVSTYHATGDGCQQATQQCILKKGVFQQILHDQHIR